MRRLVRIVAVVVILLALGQWTKDTGEPGDRRGAYEGERGKIVRVVDGDTVRVRLQTGGEVTVRLIGIDTPETKRPGTPVECGGPAATANLERLARGRITLDTDESQDVTDRYERLLAYVTNRQGVDLATAQLRAGWASTYVYDNQPFQRYGTYKSAQAAARAGDHGVWAACGGDFHKP